jgi:hypothetical protein
VRSLVGSLEAERLVALAAADLGDPDGSEGAASAVRATSTLPVR